MKVLSTFVLNSTSSKGFFFSNNFSGKNLFPKIANSINERHSKLGNEIISQNFLFDEAVDCMFRHAMKMTACYSSICSRIAKHKPFAATNFWEQNAFSNCLDHKRIPKEYFSSKIPMKRVPKFLHRTRNKHSHKR